MLLTIMYIAMNRFKINCDFADLFEETWRNRESFLSKQQGFVSFRLLRATPKEEVLHVEFVSYTEWLDQKAFQAWIDGDFSTRAHSKSKVPKEAYLGRPEFNGYNVRCENSADDKPDERSSYMDKLVEQHFSDEWPEQKALLEASVKDKLPPIQISAFEGRIIEVLLQSIGAKRGIEIGTLGGYSASWIGRALLEGGELITIEQDAVRADWARAHLKKIPLKATVEVRTGKAQDVLENMAELKDLDFVFLDADKANYPAYFEWAIERLRPGGLLIADNAYMHGGMNYYKLGRVEFDPTLGPLHNYDEATFAGMTEFWERISSDDRLKSIVLPTGQGLAIAVKT